MKLRNLVLVAVFVLFAAVNANAEKGLIAHWNFDGCSIHDVTGNGRNGIKHGDLVCTTGTKQEGIRFNQNNWIEVPNVNGDLTFQQLDSFTIELELKIDVTDKWTCNEDGKNCTDIEFIIGNTPSDSKWNYGIFYNRTYGHLASGFSGNSSRVRAYLDQGEWVTAKLTYNKGKLRIYLNDVFQQELFNDNIPVDPTSILGLGRNGGSATYGAFFQGVMDNVKIWNYATDDPSQIPVDTNEEEAPVTIMAASFPAPVEQTVSLSEYASLEKYTAELEAYADSLEVQIAGMTCVMTDGNNGHGNDPDGIDESNPAYLKGKGKYTKK